eukprot:TRINITY_DN6128_c0_g1_i1.p2 TRINITY_DN6128_c0_g1~~TRINITY_DN6128_c0_g1_i1.p2  ORF type:complete len:357 (-),score=59.62 TRINITY_DN6128_c0_g1_i1:317-1387(-)
MRRLKPRVEPADKPRILFIMAANRLCPKEAWGLSKDMRMRLKPSVSIMLNPASFFHYPALAVTTNILRLAMIDMIHVPLPYFPKCLREWDVTEWNPHSHPSIPRVEHIESLKIVFAGAGAKLLLEGLAQQRCTVKTLELYADPHASTQETVFPDGIETAILESFHGGQQGTVSVPACVKDLTLEGGWLPAHVPATLLHLRFTHGTFDAEEHLAGIAGLVSLTFDGCERDSRIVYPSTLQSLTILEEDEVFEQDPSTADLGTLPAGLTKLRIASRGIVHALGGLPRALEVLDLQGSTQFNQPLGALPPHLKELRLGPAFMQELGDLPPGLQQLTLPVEYLHALAVRGSTRVTFTNDG